MAFTHTHSYGRKPSILLSAIPAVIGWFLIAIADSISKLLLARLLIGCSFGWSYSVLPMYLAEIASYNIRGAISSFCAVGQNIGILFAFTVGSLVSMQTLAWISFAMPICASAIFVWLPESPYYLARKNRTEDGYRCLAALRQEANVRDEFKEIIMAVQCVEEKTSKFKDLLTPNSRRSFVIIVALSAIGQLSGWIAVIAYAETLFKKIETPLGAGGASIILAIVQTIASLLASMYLDKLGRRMLLLTSLAVVGICHMILAIYFTAERFYDMSAIYWLPFSVIYLYTAASNFGLGTVPAVMLGELFPANLKAMATITLVIVATTLCILVGKFFQVFTDSFGSDVPFYLFAVFCFSFWPYFWYALPETKGKSLNEILMEINSS